MDAAITLIPVAAAAFLVAVAGVAASIPLLRRYGAIADENDRTMHAGRIPKGGGLALLLAVIGVVNFFGYPMPATLTVAVAALAVVSFINDVREVPAALRLVAHIMAAAAIVMAMPADASVSQGLLPQTIDRLAAIIAVTWIMNLYNFMDGINGLAASETIAIATGYMAVMLVTTGALGQSPLAASLAGAAAGFLVWNGRQTARVFLGDSGSVPIGLLVAALMIDLAIIGQWAAAIILPLYFIADATLTLLRRMWNGEKFWHAHKSHRYQKAAHRFGAHLPVVAMVSVTNIGLIACAVWSVSAPWLALGASAILVAALFAALDRAEPVRFSGSDP